MSSIKELIKTFVFALLGIMMFVYGLYSLITSSSYIFLAKTSDLNQIVINDDIDRYENKYVSLDVDAIIDVFGQTKHTINGIIPTGTDTHYIVWLMDESFIGLSTNKNIDALDKVLQDTYNYLDYKSEYLTAEPVHVEGKLERLTGELSGYYRDVLRQWNIDSSDYPIHYNTINATESRLYILAVSLLSILAGLVLLATAFPDKINKLFNKKKDDLIEDNSPFIQQ